jgi:circadian clock protein KaiB
MKQQTDKNPVGQERLVLQLYVSGMSQKSMQAIKNIRQLCDNYLKGFHDLEIIDIYKHPELAAEQQIVFSPSLIKKLPVPRKILIGDLSNFDKVMKALGIISKQ